MGLATFGGCGTESSDTDNGGMPGGGDSDPPVVFEMDIVQGTTPILDGVIDTAEWSDAIAVDLLLDGVVEGVARVKHDGQFLWVAFSVDDATPGLDHFGDRTMIYVDRDFDTHQFPQPDDAFYVVTRGGVTYRAVGNAANSGTAGDWDTGDTTAPIVGWSAALTDQAAAGWSVEYSIELTELGLTPGSAQTLGIDFGTTDQFTTWPRWTDDPDGTNWLHPNTWGTASSSDSWAVP